MNISGGEGDRPAVLFFFYWGMGKVQAKRAPPHGREAKSQVLLCPPGLFRRVFN